MKLKGVLWKIKQNYAAYLKNAVTFLVAYTYKMNFYGCFPMCVHVSEHRSFKC
jgi:hypothetical protein